MALRDAIQRTAVAHRFYGYPYGQYIRTLWKQRTLWMLFSMNNTGVTRRSALVNKFNRGSQNERNAPVTLLLQSWQLIEFIRGLYFSDHTT
jgi:hypothetical protein